MLKACVSIIQIFCYSIIMITLNTNGEFHKIWKLSDKQLSTMGYTTDLKTTVCEYHYWGSTQSDGVSPTQKESLKQITLSRGSVIKMQIYNIKHFVALSNT